MRRLHRLLHHGQQLLAQLVQVHFLAQGGAERCQGLSGVILAAVEAPVNDPLDAPARTDRRVRAGRALSRRRDVRHRVAGSRRRRLARQEGARLDTIALRARRNFCGSSRHSLSSRLATRARY